MSLGGQTNHWSFFDEAEDRLLLQLCFYFCLVMGRVKVIGGPQEVEPDVRICSNILD